jgi:hypothetical protein
MKKEKNVKQGRNVMGLFGPKQPNTFRPFISKRMAEIAFASYKRIPEPYSTLSPSP